MIINMQELQIKTKDEDISNRLLREGNIVTSYEVTKELNNFFETYTPGLPYFRPVKLEKYQKSDKKDWNVMFQSIEEDLKNAFIIYNNQASYTVITQSNYDMEVEDVHKQVDTLIQQCQILDSYSKKKAAYYPYIISFDNLKDTNKKNLINHNIPHTTSEIDFDTSTLHNELCSTPNDKIDLSSAHVYVVSKNSSLTTSTDISTICNEFNTEACTLTMTTISSSNPAFTINIAFEEEQEMSRIELSGHSMYNTSVRLMLSPDGNNFFEKVKEDGHPLMSWRFNCEKVKGMKIIITKTDVDFEIDDKTAESYVVLKNLSAYNDKFQKTSVYTSNDIHFDKPVSDVIIDPEHSMPYGTDVSYFIGVEDKNNDVEWKTIKPGEKLDLGLLYKEEMVLNYYTSEIFGEWDFDRMAEQYAFYIHALPANSNLNSIEIRAGHSQWLIERLNVEPKYGTPYPKDKKVSPSDYSKSMVTEIAPLDSTIMEIKCEKEWNYFVMSQYAVCSKETIIENRYITFNKTSEIFDCMLLINGKQIFPKNGKYSFKLKKGENIVQILVLLGGLDVRNPDAIKTINHNFNLMAYCDALYAGPKMQRVAYNSLVNNVSNHSLKYYAIKTANGEDRIVSKFDPNYIVKPSDPRIQDRSYVIPDICMNNSEYFRVYIKFKHMLPSTLESITNSEGDSDIRLRVMAKLSTSDISVSPIIKNIKVVCE